ncbi:MAG: response regulator [Chloracidobacterium sp.]|nr:response regulator [Chloracidobacterium sp.]MDW8218614.1 response regulator [Acidobacteriota bacterium]
MSNTVLIVDDEATFRLVFKKILAKAGYNVLEAADGEAGLCQADAVLPGVILLDWIMPGLDGPEVCRRIRANAKLSESQIIMLSSRSELDDRVQGLEAGADDYLVKPCETKELLARVRSAMRIHELKHQLREKAMQLQETVAKLEELAHQREEFTAVLVHDIRSPLATVYGALELTELRAEEAGILDDNLRSIFQHGYRTLDHITKLVNEVLDFSKVEAGGATLDLDWVPIAELVQDAAAQISLSAERKGLKLRVDCPPDLPKLLLDRDKMLRAVGNLLSNAVKFTPEGGTVTLRAERFEGTGLNAGKAFVAIHVEDTGPGIPAKDLPYIFNPYYQARRRTRQLGTGLGLAIVQRITAAHGGQATVQSTEGVGTAFTLTLPVTLACALEERPQPPVRGDDTAAD